MSLRRILPITLALAAVLALGGGALAVAQSGDDDPAPRDRATERDRAEHRALRNAMLDRVGDQLARELGLPADRVRQGLREFVREQRTELHERYDTAAERREARRELRRDPEAAVRLRDELAAGLGEKLGVTGERVIAAARSLIAERLDDLVADGWLSAAERDTALACFDDPGTCVRLADRAGGLGALLGRP